jgi:hypothetical protein
VAVVTEGEFVCMLVNSEQENVCENGCGDKVRNGCEDEIRKVWFGLRSRWGRSGKARLQQGARSGRF